VKKLGALPLYHPGDLYGRENIHYSLQDDGEALSLEYKRSLLVSSVVTPYRLAGRYKCLG
jgi:hypothetical protein